MEDSRPRPGKRCHERSAHARSILALRRAAICRQDGRRLRTRAAYVLAIGGACGSPRGRAAQRRRQARRPRRFLSLNCHRLLEAYFGVLEAGGVLLPLNIRLAPDELAYHSERRGGEDPVSGERVLRVWWIPSAESFPACSLSPCFPERPTRAGSCPKNYEDLLADRGLLIAPT